jgi:2-dehydropantoate 2-reductase
VRAESDPAAVGHVDMALLAVKTYSNPDALPLLRPVVGPSTAVLTVQNGVESAEEIARVIAPEAVLAGATYIIASMVEPAVIQHTGTARRIVFGEAFGERVVSKRAAEIERVLAGADIEAEAVADSRVPIWEKFLFLAPFAGLTAAARLPLGPLWGVPAFRAAYDEAMGEVEAIARAEGIAVAADVRAQKLAYLDRSPSASRSSLMMDLLAGKPTEVEALLGSAVRRGARAGVPTPIMQALYGVLKPYEHGTPQV